MIEPLLFCHQWSFRETFQFCTSNISPKWYLRVSEHFISSFTTVFALPLITLIYSSNKLYKYIILYIGERRAKRNDPKKAKFVLFSNLKNVKKFQIKRSRILRCKKITIPCLFRGVICSARFCLCYNMLYSYTNYINIKMEYSYNKNNKNNDNQYPLMILMNILFYG